MTLNDILGTLTETLRENGIDQPIIKRVVEEVQQAAEEEKAAREPKAPRVKPQTWILLPPTPLSPADGNPVDHPPAGWVVQTDPECPAGAVIDRLRAAATVFNQSRAGKRNPVKCLGELLEAVKPKHLKDEARPDARTKVVTPEMVQVIAFDPDLL